MAAKMERRFIVSSSGLAWKERCWWIGGCALGIIVVTITIALVAKDEKVTSYLGAIATASSIVLAVVAIIYSSLERMDSRRQVGEMETLVRQASGIMREKADVFASQAEAMERTVMLLQAQLPMQDTEAGGEDVSDGRSEATYPVRLSGMSSYALRVLYLFAKSRKAKVPSVKRLDAISLCRGYTPSEYYDVTRIGTFLGMFYGTVGCLMGIEGVKIIIAQESKEMCAAEFSPEIETAVVEALDRRIKDARTPARERDEIRSAIRRIDEYVQAK